MKILYLLQAAYEEARSKDIGLPCVVVGHYMMPENRHAVAFNKTEFFQQCDKQLQLSPTTQVSIEPMSFLEDAMNL